MTTTRTWAGTMSRRSDTSSPMRCKGPEQHGHTGLATSTRVSTRGRWAGNAPRFTRRLVLRAVFSAGAASSAWACPAASSCSASSSPSRSWSSGRLSARRPKRCRCRALMIWRSRSLSARSSSSIALSVLGSSERAGAGAVTNRLDYALQALAIALLNCTTLFCSARHSGHRDLPRRVPPLPIEPFEQGGELGCGQPHGPVLDLGPAELALFQPLGDENYARAVPEDKLDPVSTPHIIPHTV